MPPVAPSVSASFGESVAIYGVGLIGGSIAAALKQRGFAGRIIGVGRNRERLEGARQLGLLDEATDDPDAAARSADLLIFCTPVDQIVAGVQRAARHSRPGTLLTDAGSVKGPICRALENALPPDVTFLGSHPLAGSEKQGFAFAKPDLYVNRVCVLTPTTTSPAAEMQRLDRFWSGLGARVVVMTPEAHDEAVATTSHAPHVIAAAVAAILRDDQRNLAATGFRDTTRIAAGDPDLWVAILRQNASAVLSAIGRFENALADFRGALESQDDERLKNLLATAKRNRDAL